MVHEKRRFSRVHFGVEAQLLVNEKIYTTGEVMDLGIGGCLLGIAANLKPGAVCSLRMVLGDAENGPEIRVGGEVIRSDGGTVALRFKEIDPESLAHLQNVVRYNAEDSEPIEQEIKEHPGIF